MKTLLITGANGFLGYRLAKHYADKYQVTAFTHHDLDITNPDAVQEKVASIQPDVLIHCAAISNPSVAAQHPELAHQVNVEGTLNLAKACLKNSVKFIFMSSDQVYNGTSQKGLLTESVPLCPTDVYGQNKLETEQKVFALLPDAVALRLTWMYDAPESEKVNVNIITLLMEACEKGNPMKCSTNEYRGFTDVKKVAVNMEKCFALPGGAYNFGSSTTLNYYESFLQMAHKLKLPNAEQWILPDNTTPFVNIAMNTDKTKRFGIEF